MFSGSVDAGFVLALSFHNGDLEPDCVEVSTRGGLCARGGGVFAGHYGTCAKDKRVSMHHFPQDKAKW